MEVDGVPVILPFSSCLSLLDTWVSLKAEISYHPLGATIERQAQVVRLSSPVERAREVTAFEFC